MENVQEKAQNKKIDLELIIWKKFDVFQVKIQLLKALYRLLFDGNAILR